MDQTSIGEFARRSRLSAKALRLYDELGLLPPARVDEDSGYRICDRLVHLLAGRWTLARSRITAARRDQRPHSAKRSMAWCPPS